MTNLFDADALKIVGAAAKIIFESDPESAADAKASYEAFRSKFPSLTEMQFAEVATYFSGFFDALLDEPQFAGAENLCYTLAHALAGAAIWDASQK
jgi:hypothetical protein